jgi:hypothetical protein
MSFLKNIFTCSEFILVFTHFLFFKYFESMNSKITDFEIQWRPNPSNFSKIQ